MMNQNPTHTEPINTNFNTKTPPHHIDEEEVYQYYKQNLLPAILSSIPILISRLFHDATFLLSHYTTRFIQFLFPVWFRQWTADTQATITHAAHVARDAANEGSELLSQYWKSSGITSKGSGSNFTFLDYMMQKLDVDHDGHISAPEWLLSSTNNAEEIKREVEALIHQYYHALADNYFHQHQAPSWWDWINDKATNIIRGDWKLGAYLWHTCSGLILVLIVTSIVPGRLHGWTGRALRFPILGMVYMLITAELFMYTIIRLAIRLAEFLFANPKHRSLRQNMENAKSYEEWYRIAKCLDESQGRDRWQKTVNDDTAYRYSWPFILELLSDLKSSRENEDIIMALAVLQQCTRKNVGGIMSDDMFSFTNCGEPKDLVTEFIDEVAMTLKWVTDEVRDRVEESRNAVQDPKAGGSENRLNNDNGKGDDENEGVLRKSMDSNASQKEQTDFDRELKSKIQEEQNKMFRSLLSWATLNLLGTDSDNKENDSKTSSTENLGQNSSSDHLQNCNRADEQEQSPSQTPVTNEVANEEYTKNLVLREKIKTFLKRARAAYGRTALCLSGGAMMGNYHFGSVLALLQTGLLPHIISGTSAGSVIGAMLCTRTEKELLEDLKPEILAPNMSIFASSWSDRIKKWYKNGSMFDQEDWMNRVKWFTNGDMTFEEAYKKTGRVLCITLSATSKKSPPILINYITAPNVVIASAVVASAAVPGFIDPMKLLVKEENGLVRNRVKNKDEEYRDGSIDSDIPTTGLAEMLNCQFFLAAQANPHIVPFFYNSKGDVGRPSRWSSGMRDDSWRGGFLLSALEMYLKNDMRSKFNFLNDLEVALGFTSTMMTQNYSGTTTIVPQVCLKDFFVLFSDQTVDDMKRYFQGGSVAAYQHMGMLKLHYKIAHALDECLANLEYDEAPAEFPSRRRSQLVLKQKTRSSIPKCGLHFTKLEPTKNFIPGIDDDTPPSTVCDDEYETGGFDGVECAFGPGRAAPFS